jgi:hypothetical protein
MREQVQQIEDMMQGMPPAFLPIKHYFANGMYAREMFMPAGTILNNNKQELAYADQLKLEH